MVWTAYYFFFFGPGTAISTGPCQALRAQILQRGASRAQILQTGTERGQILQTGAKTGQVMDG